MDGFDLRARWKEAFLSFGIVAVSFYVLVSSVDVGEVVATIYGADIWLYTAAVGLFYLTFPLRGLRWRLMLDNAGVEAEDRDATETVFLSFFLNNVVPAKLGDVYRAHRIRPSEGEPRSRIFGTVVTCRFIDLLFLVVAVTGLGGIVMASRFSWLAEYLVYFYGGLIVGGVGFFLLRERVLEYVVPERIVASLMNVKEGFVVSMSDRVGLVIGLTAIIWGLVALRVFMVFGALGMEAGILFAAFLGFFMIALSAFPLTPAGAGVVEVVSTTFLAFYGFEGSMGAAVVLMDRSITFMSLIVIGGLYVLVVRRDFMESLHRAVE